MNYLLDTQLLLWVAGDSKKLPKPVRQLVEDSGNKVYFSAASIWEIVIKNSLNREDFQADAKLIRRGLLENGYVELPITSLHTLALESMPSIHKDPFDRILIAQAKTEGIILMTSDEAIGKYEGPITVVR